MTQPPMDIDENGMYDFVITEQMYDILQEYHYNIKGCLSVEMAIERAKESCENTYDDTWNKFHTNDKDILNSDDTGSETIESLNKQLNDILKEQEW